MSTEAAPVQTAPPTETTTEVDPLEALTQATLRNAPPAEIARLKAAMHAEPVKEESKTEPEPEVAETETTEETATEDEKAAAKAPETTEEEDEQEPKDGKKRRFRFSDPDDELILLTAKRKGISVAEAARRLEGQAETPKETPKEVPGLSQEPVVDVAALETELADIQAKLDTAIGTDEGDAVLITPAIRKLQRREAELMADIRSEKSAAKTLAHQIEQIKGELSQAEFDRQRNTVLKETAKVYPAMADPKSAQFRIAKSIGMEWRDPGHPMHPKLFEPDGPRLIAEEAAKVLDIKPATAKQEVKKAVETPKPGPAPGSLKSTPPTTQQTKEERIRISEQKLEAVQSGKTKMAASRPKSYVM